MPLRQGRKAYDSRQTSVLRIHRTQETFRIQFRLQRRRPLSEMQEGTNGPLRNSFKGGVAELLRSDDGDVGSEGQSAWRLNRNR